MSASKPIGGRTRKVSILKVDEIYQTTGEKFQAMEPIWRSGQTMELYHNAIP